MMKRSIALALTLALLALACVPAALAGEGGAVVLPETLTEIAEQAFLNDVAMTSVVIPKSVQQIGSRAFAGCLGLKEVYLGNNAEIQIPDDVFDGCGDIHFYAFPDTAGELFALSHGYQCDLLEDGGSFLERALTLVTQNGGTASILKSDDFSAKRLIVRMKGERLPDISAHKPKKILSEGDGIFFIQFNSVIDTMKAYSQIASAENVLFVESDACIEVNDDVEASGYVDHTAWDTDDPMRFGTYVPFVRNSSRRATIAVIDSGVKRAPAYASMLRADGVNLVTDGGSWTNDSQMHGSMIAGIIKDCVGDANVDILPIRVVSSEGHASLTMIGLGIKYALEHGANVINLSMNFEENEYVKYWLGRAKAMGVSVVVAAGNSARNVSRVFPANVPGIIAVSGIESSYEMSGSSNFGNNISYCAPDTGVICSAYPSMARRGTSFAAPMVASALALLQLDVYHSEEDLRACCRDLGDPGRDDWYGYGLIQMDKLARVEATKLSLDEDTPTIMYVGETHVLKWTAIPDGSADGRVTVTSNNEDVIAIEEIDGQTVMEAVGVGSVSVTVKIDGTEGADEISDSVTVRVRSDDMRVELKNVQTDDVYMPGDTAEWDVSKGSLDLTVPLSSVYTIMSMGSKARVIAYSQNEAPDLGDFTLSGAVGEPYCDEDWMLNQWLDAAVEMKGLLFKASDLSRAPYLKVMIGVYAEADDATPTDWYVFAFRITGSSAYYIPLTGVRLNSMALGIVSGASFTLKPTFIPAEATNQHVTWISDDTTVVTVSPDGVVTAHDAGEATVTARCADGVEAACYFHVIWPRPILQSSEVKGTDVILTWNPVDRASRYRLQYVEGEADFGKEWITTTDTTYTITGLSENTDYRIAIVAEVLGTDSSWTTFKVTTGVADDATVYRALLVGVDQPFQMNEGLANNDVMLMYNTLVNLNAPDGRYNVKKLINPSEESIFESIHTFLGAADENDVSLFYISAPAEYTASDDSAGGMIIGNDLSFSTVYLSQWAEALTAVPGKVILIFETCGSGAAVKNNSMFRQEKFCVLTATAYQEQSWSQASGNSYFTRWLCDGLGTGGQIPADANVNGIVTLDELYGYITRRSEETVFDTGAGKVSQHPQVYPENSDYPLFTR